MDDNQKLSVYVERALRENWSLERMVGELHTLPRPVSAALAKILIELIQAAIEQRRRVS